jgi:small subunit ribosomal protein S20
MPNTKSAERRMRGSARKHLNNQMIKHRLKTLERNYLAAVNAGDKQLAADTLRLVSSAFDKAAKTGVVHRASASRKKSRLATRLNHLK